jgi:hypothetical protein
MKRLIIRWSNRQLAKMINEGWIMTYHDLGKYGVADWITNENTGEPMLVLDGIKPWPSWRPPKDASS